jgi:hypothetical protein
MWLAFEMFNSLQMIANESKMDGEGFKVDDHKSDENMTLDKREQNINEGSEFVLSHGAERTIPDDESSRLKELDANVRNQDDLERDIGLQVCYLI